LGELSASPYVLIAASTAVVGTLLVTELIRRRIGLEEGEAEEEPTILAPQPAPSINEIEAEDFSPYEGVAEVLSPPQERPVEERKASRPRRQRRRRIGKRLERKIIKMWEKGVPIKKIAEELDLSYSAVYRKIKKYKESSRK